MNNITTNPLKDVLIYTDGACVGNPGPGGYGVILDYKGQRKELSAGYRRTTNNRMELMAAISGLEALKERCNVTIYSDSQYLVKAVSLGWAQRWRAKGWKRGNNRERVNADLWARLLDLYDEHEVKFEWVRGHAGDPMNERCDRLAMAAATGRDLAVDEGYEGTPGKAESPRVR